MNNNMKKIKDLSKQELLTLIYNNLSRTVFDDHPVFCVACSKITEELVPVHGTVVKAKPYICDRCEDSIS